MNDYQNNQYKKRGIIESIMPLLKIYISNTIYCKPYSYVKNYSESGETGELVSSTCVESLVPSTLID
jgi:hypothetical protein